MMDLIISDDYNTGRSRKSGGKSILIADRRNVERESINIEREYMMNQAVVKLLSLSPDVVLTDVRELQEKICREEQEEDEMNEAIADSKLDERFEMICGLCGKFDFSSDGIRCYKKSQYVVVDSNFYKNIIWKPHQKSNSYDAVQKTHKIYGKCCEHDWGIGVLLHNNRCAVLKLASFVVNGERYKSWKDVPYRVTTFDMKEDIKRLLVINKSNAENV